MRLSESVYGATVIVYPAASLVKVEGRLATLLGDDGGGGSLVSPRLLVHGARKARAAVESLGVSMATRAQVQRLDLAAELLFFDGQDGLAFLKASQRGLHLPALVQVPHYATGDSRLESIIWRTPKGRQERARLYDAGAHHGTHRAGERLRFEVQERWTGTHARTPEQVAALDLGGLYGRRLRGWLKQAHVVAVTTPPVAITGIYDKARVGSITLRRAHSLATMVVSLSAADDLLSAHERNRRKRELRKAGMTLDVSGDQDGHQIDLRPPLAALVEAW